MKTKKEISQKAWRTVANLVTFAISTGLNQEEDDCEEFEAENDYIALIILPKLWKLGGLTSEQIKAKQYDVSRCRIK